MSADLIHGNDKQLAFDESTLAREPLVGWPPGRSTGAGDCKVSPGPGAGNHMKMRPQTDSWPMGAEPES